MTARGTLTRREMVLLRLRTDEGLVGLGEAVPLSLRGGASVERVVRELEAFAEAPELAARLAGESPGEDVALGAAAGLSPPARCALLTALLDLRGRVADAGRATARLLNPAGQGRQDPASAAEPVVCNATLVAGEPAAVAADALRWAEEGFQTFKLKLGGDGDDIGQVRAVREALGPGPRIRIDANAAWDVETAKRTLAALEPFEIELAEQPVARLEEMAEVARATSIPLAGDESVNSAADAERALAIGACRFTGVKLSKVGGPEEALAIADLLPAYVSSALDGPVGIAAAAQVAQTMRERSARTASTSPTASPPSASSPRRSPPSSASCAATACTHLPAPASASRSTRRRSPRTGSSLLVALSSRIARTSRHTTRWTRPTPTPPSPPPSPRSWPGAACGTRWSPPARARPRSRWRCGARRGSR